MVHIRLPRIRYSLRSFFLALLVLSLTGSNLYVSYKWRHAQTDVQQLRDELGLLTIDDPTRFYVREALTHRWLEWRWRIYVPSDAVFCIAKREIPVSGVTRAEHIYCGAFPSGEQLIDLRLEPRESGGGDLSLVGSGIDGSMVSVSSPVSREEAPWLYESDETDLIENNDTESNMDEQPETVEVAGSGGRAQSLSFDAPVVLLRLRHPRQQQSIHDECDGLMIWIEKR